MHRQPRQKRPKTVPPDGYVYRADETGEPTWLCAHCLACRSLGRGAMFTCWQGLIDHLKCIHGEVKVCVLYHNPHYDAAVQLALPIVLDRATIRS